jgi:hypothetical protein
MLGWEIFITRKEPGLNEPSAESSLASWKTGLNGDNWLRDLVKQGLAQDLGSNGGYPHLYSAKAKEIIPIISRGAPAYKGGLVVGEDYVLDGGKNWDININQSKLSKCDPDDVLIIEAWDQS